jgi:hypothetical protein
MKVWIGVPEFVKMEGWEKETDYTSENQSKTT